MAAIDNTTKRSPGPWDSPATQTVVRGVSDDPNDPVAVAAAAAHAHNNPRNLNKCLFPSTTPPGILLSPIYRAAAVSPQLGVANDAKRPREYIISPPTIMSPVLPADAGHVHHGLTDAELVECTNPERDHSLRNKKPKNEKESSDADDTDAINASPTDTASYDN